MSNAARCWTGGVCAVLSLMAAGPAIAGFDIKEKGRPGATVQVYLTSNFPGEGHVRWTRPDGTPWPLTIGPSGSATLSFGDTIDIRDQHGNKITIPSRIVTDFEQYTAGIKVGGGPIPGPFSPLSSPPQIDPDAVAALQGAYLGPGPTFTLNPMEELLPASPDYLPMPDFLADLDNNGTITAAENIYVAVNMSVWEPVSHSLPFGTTLSVADGVSADLPGYYFSLTPITFSSSLGWTSDAPLTSNVYSVAEHQLNTTPEPSVWGALGIGVFGLCVLAWRRRAAV